MLVNIGKGIELDVDTNRLGFPSDIDGNVKGHIIYIGLRNILMDSHAGVTEAKVNGGDVAAESKAVALKKLDALYRGEVRAATFLERDPVKARAQELVTKALLAKYRSEGKKPDAKDCAKEAKALLANARPDNKFVVQARKDVETSRALAADLDDLV